MFRQNTIAHPEFDNLIKNTDLIKNIPSKAIPIKKMIKSQSFFLKYIYNEHCNIIT